MTVAVAPVTATTAPTTPTTPPVAVAPEPLVQWMAPSPLWPGLAAAGDPAFRRPAMLRFASDRFMDEFMALLERDPARLAELRVVPETWRAHLPPPEPPAPVPAFARDLHRKRLMAARATQAAQTAQTASTGGATVAAAAPAPLKLYQPAHQRYYLVTACLVCRLPGLPDRILNTAAEERAGFVVRRLRHRDPATDPRTPCDPETCDEYALVDTGRGPAWQKLTGVPGRSPLMLAPGEEVLPFFPMNFTEDDGRRRRVFAGLVPVGRREAYLGAGAASERGADGRLPRPEDDPRRTLLRTQVTEPLRNVLGTAQATHAVVTKANGNDTTKVLKDAREQIQTLSWYLLLDFAAYLRQHLPAVWATVEGRAPGRALTAAEQALVDRLKALTISSALRTELLKPQAAPPLPPVAAYTTGDVWSALDVALANVTAFEGRLEDAATPYDRRKRGGEWPEKLFPIADPVQLGPLQVIPNPPTTPLEQKVDELERLIEAALPAESTAPAPAPRLAQQAPLDARDPGWFIIRCVFERPHCGPLAGLAGGVPIPDTGAGALELTPALLSSGTGAFQMAPFFDPDAPARPIRITLPMDTTPAGLRKFDKNTAFMISDVLCGQMDALGNITLGDLVLSVLPWPFHKDLPVPAGGSNGPCPEGQICTLSIPIITICAMILLMIIVKLLDIIFFWIPFFRVCFRLPRFTAKG